MSDEISDDVIRVILDIKDYEDKLKRMVDLRNSSAEDLDKISVRELKNAMAMAEQEQRAELDAYDQIAKERQKMADEIAKIDRARVDQQIAEAERLHKFEADLSVMELKERNAVAQERARATSLEARATKLQADEAAKNRAAEATANMKYREQQHAAVDQAIAEAKAKDAAIVKAEYDMVERIMAEQKKLRAFEHDLAQAEIAEAKQIAEAKVAAEKAAANAKFSAASRGLRVGAGIAGATGNYQLGAAAYGVANAVDLAATAGISGAAIVATGAVVGLAAAVGGLLYVGKDLNEALANMSTLMGTVGETSKQTQDQINSVVEGAGRVSTAFNVDLIDVVKGFKDALSSGIDAKDLERFGMEAGKMSAALDVSFKDATNILTSFKDSYGETIQELAHTNDVLFNIVNVGKVNVDQLINSMGKLLPVGKAAGLGIEDLGAAVALLTRHGMTSSQSITSVIQVIQGLVNPSQKAKKALDEAGIATGDMAFQGKNLVEVVKEITDSTGGKGGLLGALFPEERAFRGVAIMTQANGELEKMKAAMYEVGTASEAAAKAQDTLWANVSKLIKGAWNDVTELGSKFAEVLNTHFFGTREYRQAEQSLKDQNIQSYLQDPSKFTSGGGEGHFDKNETDENRRRQGGFTDQEVELYKIQAAAEKADKAVKDLNDSLYKPAFTSVAGGAGDAPESKKRSQLEQREFESRANKDQKQDLLDLKLEMEDINAEKDHGIRVDEEAFATANSGLLKLRDQYVANYKAQMAAGQDAYAAGTLLQIKALDAQLKLAEDGQKKELDTYKETEKQKIDLKQAEIDKLRDMVMQQMPEFARQEADKEIDIVKKAQDKIVEIKRQYVQKFEELEKDRLKVVQTYADKEKAIGERAQGRTDKLDNTSRQIDITNSTDSGSTARMIKDAMETISRSLEGFARSGDESNFDKQTEQLESLYQQYAASKIASGDNARRYGAGGGASFENTYGQLIRDNKDLLKESVLSEAKVKEQKDLNDISRRASNLRANEAHDINEQEVKVKEGTAEVARLATQYGNAQVGAIIESKLAAIKAASDGSKAVTTAITTLRTTLDTAIKNVTKAIQGKRTDGDPMPPTTPVAGSDENTYHGDNLPTTDDPNHYGSAGGPLPTTDNPNYYDNLFDSGVNYPGKPSGSVFDLPPISTIQPSAMGQRAAPAATYNVNIDSDGVVDPKLLKSMVTDTIKDYHKTVLVKGAANQNDTMKTGLYANKSTVKSTL